jgi:hypothetical protein
MGSRRVPIRYVLVRDPTGEHEPQAFLCTDLDAAPLDILRWFVRRWFLEVTFAEVRRHLGVETQRQSSDPAIDPHHAGTAGAVLAVHALGGRCVRGTRAIGADGRLVSEVAADVQRRSRHRSTADLRRGGSGCGSDPRDYDCRRRWSRSRRSYGWTPATTPSIRC